MAKVLDFELLGIHIQKMCISNQPIKGEGYSAKAISEAMFKSGKAVRYSLASSGRQALLRLSAAQRKLKVWYSADWKLQVTT